MSGCYERLQPHASRKTHACAYGCTPPAAAVCVYGRGCNHMHIHMRHAGTRHLQSVTALIAGYCNLYRLERCDGLY